jgi:sulfatase modifying factor 1
MTFERLQTTLLSLTLFAGCVGCASAPVIAPEPEVAPVSAVLPEPKCPGVVADNPEVAYREGLALVDSSKGEKYRGGLTYQAGLERLLEAARAGHPDAQYLYGWRLLLDAYDVREPVEEDLSERLVYEKALSFIALAASYGQVEAVAFFPRPVLQGILTPLVAYTPVAELEGTAFEHIPASWVEHARLHLIDSSTCVKRERPLEQRSEALPEPPKGFVSVPAGRYVAGPVDISPGTDALSVRDQPLIVTFTRALFVQATEVTRAQWKDAMGRLPKGQPGCSGELCPVSAVTWLEAVKYVNRLSKKQQLSPCYRIKRKTVSFAGVDCPGYRLPTDAEWEYFSRAGLGGERYALLADIARISEGANPTQGPGPAASLAANAWGLYDTLGNVSEWCHDLYERQRAADVVDPTGTRYGVNRVVRGGSFASKGEEVRFSVRKSADPASSSPQIGLRPVRTILTEP